jgi:hypothetical protein
MMQQGKVWERSLHDEKSIPFQKLDNIELVNVNNVV